MDSEKRAQLMGNESIPVILKKLALPAIIGMLVIAIYNIADTLFVARIGVAQVSATSVAYPLFMLISAIGLMYGIGAASYVSILLGKGDKKRADIVASTTFFTSLITGILASIVIIIFIKQILNLFGATESNISYAIEYSKILAGGSIFTILNMTMNNLLRAEGSAKYSMMALLLGALLNIVLDPIFIFTFDLGVGGAAIATVIAQSISTALLISLYLRKKTHVHISIKNFHPKFDIYSHVYKIGFPTFIRQFLMSVSMGLMNTAVKPYGDGAIAGVGISLKVFSLAAMVLFGFSQGFQPIVGFNYGALKIHRVKEVLWVSLKWTTTFSTISAIILAIFAPQIIGLFNTDTEIVRVGSSFLRAMCLLLPLFAFQVLYGTLFQSIGKGREAAILSLARQGIFLIPAILYLPSQFGFNGIVWAQPVADFLTILLTGYFAIKVHKEFKLIEAKKVDSKFNTLS